MFDVFVRKYITVKNIIFFIIAILFLIFITKIKDIAILFFASYVIACSLNPLVDKLEKRMSRSLASTIVLTVILGISSVILAPIFIIGAQQIKSFINMIPDYVNNFKLFIAQNPLLSKTNLSDLDVGNLISSTSDFTTKFVNGSINAGMEFASAIVYFLAACIIIYYFLADKDIVRKTYLTLFPRQMNKRA